jgi:TRAP-type C4-dicarboxylate transport system permease large subunit
VSGIDRTIPIQTIFRGAMPFLLALLAAALLLIFFPGIATWLPGVAG